MRLPFLLLLCTVIGSNAVINKYYFDNWCGGELQYLDDRECKKVFSSNSDRNFQCSNGNLKDKASEGFDPEMPLYSHTIDKASLSKYVHLSQFSQGQEVRMCVIVTERVKDSFNPNGFTTYNKYYCYDDMSVTVPYEPWSSSKIFAMGNAAGHLRSNESKCSGINIFGLDDSTSGKQSSQTLLADLATIVCSYDHTKGYSSNSLSSYFHDLGWRQRLHDLVNSTWLDVPNKDQSLGGNYGEATPADLGFVITNKNGQGEQCSADKDPWPVIYENKLSALSESEMTRRLALHRELPEGQRFPGANWPDIQAILYGANDNKSNFFPGLNSGGMTVDTAIFLQSTKYIQQLLGNSNVADNWRIFSKLGAGYSSSRSRGEIVSNAYACIPKTSDTGAETLEVTVTVRASVPLDSSLTKAETLLLQAMDGAMDMVKALHG